MVTTISNEFFPRKKVNNSNIAADTSSSSSSLPSSGSGRHYDYDYQTQKSFCKQTTQKGSWRKKKKVLMTMSTTGIYTTQDVHFINNSVARKSAEERRKMKLMPVCVDTAYKKGLNHNNKQFFLNNYITLKQTEKRKEKVKKYIE